MLHGDAEVERRAVGCGRIREHDVGATLHFRGDILPHRAGVLGVVGRLDLVGRTRGNIVDHGHNRSGDVAFHGQRRLQRDRRLGDCLREARREGHGLLAVAHLDGEGVAAVEDLLEVRRRGRVLERERGAAGDVAAGLRCRTVQLLRNGQIKILCIHDLEMQSLQVGACL